MKTTENQYGLATTSSPYEVQETVDLISNVLRSVGMTIFATIDHAMAASRADFSLRPTQTIIFGNPQSGTPFMLKSQTAAIDLPQKMLVWQDREQKVWIAYNTPEYIAQRHGIKDTGDLLNNVSQALEKIVASAVA